MREIHNREFERILDTSDERIFQRTGIRSRRFCSESESSATLAIAAARDALTAGGVRPKEIDLIICGTATPERTTPSNAAQVQAALGCRTIPGFDLSSACSGFLFALTVAHKMMIGETAHTTALVIGAESLSRVLDYTDRNTCVLFGDGAGAAVLRTCQNTECGIHFMKTGTDGSAGDLIQVPGNTQSNNGLATRNHRSVDFINVSGPETFRFAVKTMTDVLRELKLALGFAWPDVAAIIPHQANRRVLTRVASLLNIPIERFVINIGRYGNTGAASVPIALNEAIRDHRANKGDLVVLVAVGGGLSWSAVSVVL